MNKEDVLAKSKKENIYGDEREREVRTKRDAFAGWGFTVLGIIIMIIKIFHGDSASDIISILFCTSGLAFTYEGMKLQKNGLQFAELCFCYSQHTTFIDFALESSNE